MRYMITMAMIFSFGTVLLIAARKQENPLPEAKDVKSITITFHHPKQRDEVKFSATAEDWDAIRAAMLPAKHDPSPAKWVSSGSLRIEKTDGQPFLVELYATGEDLSAFAAGKTFEERVYYRGGKSDEIVKAVQAAYERSRTEKK